MWFSRIWIVLLATAAALAIGIAWVVPGPPQRDLAAAKRRAIDHMQHNAELLLKQEARDWIDAASTLSKDATLVRVLNQASISATPAKGVALQRDRAKSRLLQLLGQLKPENRPKLVIAVDFRGKQICRIGPGEDKYRPGIDGLAGYPLVEQALRGFQLDDTWSLDGKLYLVAAAPVISRQRGRYVGALVLGQELDNVFAARLKSRLAGTKAKQTHVAFFLRGATVASTLSTKVLKTLPQQYTKHRKQVATHGRTAAVYVPSSDGGHTVVMASLPGEAASHQAFYAVVGPPLQVASGLGKAIGRLDKADMKQFPWLLVAGMALLLSVLGILLVQIEGRRPAKKLLGELLKMAKGDSTRVEPRAHAGAFRQMAQAINDAFDRSGSRRAPGSVGSKDINQILGAPEEQGTRPDLRLEPSSNEMPPLAAGVKALSRIPSKPLLPASDGGMPPIKPMSLDPEDAPTALDDGPGFGETMPLGDPIPIGDPIPLPGGTDDGLPAVSTSDPSGMPAVTPIDLPGASSPDVEPLQLDNSPLPAASSEKREDPSSLSVRLGDKPKSKPDKGGAAKAPPPPAPPAETDFSDLLDDSSVGLPAADDGLDDKTKPSMAPPPAAASADADADADADKGASDAPDPTNPADIEAYFEQVYKDFIAIKRQCGESVDNITYSRFSGKLRKNRQSLIDRYSCKGVKFQVYVKDGKAALKATPIKS